MCPHVRECSCALNSCSMWTLAVSVPCPGQGRAHGVGSEQQSAAANVLEVVVLLCWSWAKEEKCNLKLCAYAGKSKRAQMFILVYLASQIDLQPQTAERCVMGRGCLFPGWISKMLVSTSDVPVSRYVLLPFEWRLKRPSFPMPSSADSRQTCSLWIFP